MKDLERRVDKNEENIRELARAMLSTRSMYLWGTMMNAIIFALLIIFVSKGI